MRLQSVRFAVITILVRSQKYYVNANIITNTGTAITQMAYRAVLGSHSDTTMNSSFQRVWFSLTSNSMTSFSDEKKFRSKAQDFELLVQYATGLEILYTAFSKSNWTRM